MPIPTHPMPAGLGPLGSPAWTAGHRGAPFSSSRAGLRRPRIRRAVLVATITGSVPSRCPGRSGRRRPGGQLLAGDSGQRLPQLLRDGGAQMADLAAGLDPDRPGRALGRHQRPDGFQVPIPGVGRAARRSRTAPPVPPRWHPADQTCRPVGGPGGRGIASRDQFCPAVDDPVLTSTSFHKLGAHREDKEGLRTCSGRSTAPGRPSPQLAHAAGNGTCCLGANGGAVMKPLLAGPLSRCCSSVHAHRGHWRARPVDCRGRVGHRIGRYRPGEAGRDGAPVTGGCLGSWASVVPGACR